MLKTQDELQHGLVYKISPYSGGRKYLLLNKKEKFDITAEEVTSGN